MAKVNNIQLLQCRLFHNIFKTYFLDSIFSRRQKAKIIHLHSLSIFENMNIGLKSIYNDISGKISPMLIVSLWVKYNRLSILVVLTVIFSIISEPSEAFLTGNSHQKYRTKNLWHYRKVVPFRPNIAAELCKLDNNY